jgi:tRNA (guanine10-N2)-methyltransferase
MKNPEQEFCIFEEYKTHLTQVAPESQDQETNGTAMVPATAEEPSQDPFMVYLGRLIARGSREVVGQYDLKKRKYISTTSMESALSLLTANMTLAAPGKVFCDPFVGTGSFCVAAGHFGALGMGSDIDGRSFNGKESKDGKRIGLKANLEQYGLESHFLDAFIADLTNTPIRDERLFDGIMCDPPYGVREGLRVLGSRHGREKGQAMVDGIPTHLYGTPFYFSNSFSPPED